MAVLPALTSKYKPFKSLQKRRKALALLGQKHLEVRNRILTVRQNAYLAGLQ
jgi:hypothetical protein